MTAPVLEVIVTSLDDAMEAERGGATRLEVVRELDRGGLTPPLALVHDILAAVRIPIRVMLRESEGYAISGSQERDGLFQIAGELSALRIDGLVIGFVRGRSADLVTTMEVLAAAPGLSCTFHHAFDDLADSVGTLATLKTCGRIDYVLTHGGWGTMETRAAWLRALAQAASPEISLMVGGGVDAPVICGLRREGYAGAFHVGRASARIFGRPRVVHEGAGTS